MRRQRLNFALPQPIVKLKGRAHGILVLTASVALAAVLMHHYTELAGEIELIEARIGSLTRLTHALLPGILRSGRGAILNVSSITAYLPMPQMAVYAATKAYVNSFTEALRAELRGTGVLVSALCPGPVDTEFGTQAKRAGEEDAMPAPKFLKQPVERIVRDGLRGLDRGRARTIPGSLGRTKEGGGVGSAFAVHDH